MADARFADALNAGDQRHVRRQLLRRYGRRAPGNVTVAPQEIIEHVDGPRYADIEDRTWTRPSRFFTTASSYHVRFRSGRTPQTAV